MTVAEVLASTADYIDAENANIFVIDKAIFKDHGKYIAIADDEDFQKYQDREVSSYNVELPVDEDEDVAEIYIRLGVLPFN
jgi:hypothetical protein